MSMDVKQLPEEEQAAYLAIVDGCDVSIKGKKGQAIVQRTANDRQYEVYNPSTEEISKPIKYPIDALSLACKIVGGFLDWKAVE